MYKRLKSYYESKGYSDAVFQEAVRFIDRLREWSHINPSEMTTAQVEAFIANHVETDELTLNGLIGLARFFYVEGMNGHYIFLLRYLGGIGVLENIEKRVADQAGEAVAALIFNEETRPPVGTSQRDLPKYTNKLLEGLQKHLTQEQVETALAGNNHDIPDAPFVKERAILEAFGDLDAYLKDYHQRQVAELQRHADEGTVWFEQKITQAVVDHVASNQEIQSAVRVGDKLCITKIPYEPDAYLKTDDPKMKAYYACHCPFARESILSGQQTVGRNWCYCSAGFVKHPYEVLFGRPLKVRLLESALEGSPVCRFEIDIAES